LPLFANINAQLSHENFQGVTFTSRNGFLGIFSFELVAYFRDHKSLIFTVNTFSLAAISAGAAASSIIFIFLLFCCIALPT
jgi:hypothetical protein